MWFKVDDGWSEHRKVRKAGLHGRALWMTSGVMCAAANAEGLVEADMMDVYLFHAQCDGELAVPALVASGLWHDRRSLNRCESCKTAVAALPAKKLGDGDFYFHDWLDYQFTRDEAKVPEHRRKKMRNKALNRDRKLIGQIIDRDGTLCRYCGIRVDFRDRRGPYGGTYDHVDPDGGNTLENVVVACRQCNSVKRDNTPDEAGMTLLEPGTSWTPIQSGPETGPGNAVDASDRDLASRALRAPTGTGLAGLVSGIGSGRVPGQESGRAPVPVDPHGPDPWNGLQEPPEPDPAHATNGHTNGAH